MVRFRYIILNTRHKSDNDDDNNNNNHSVTRGLSCSESNDLTL